MEFITPRTRCTTPRARAAEGGERTGGCRCVVPVWARCRWPVHGRSADGGVQHVCAQPELVLNRALLSRPNVYPPTYSECIRYIFHTTLGTVFTGASSSSQMPDRTYFAGVPCAASARPQSGGRVGASSSRRGDLHLEIREMRAAAAAAAAASAKRNGGSKGDTAQSDRGVLRAALSSEGSDCKKRRGRRWATTPPAPRVSTGRPPKRGDHPYGVADAVDHPSGLSLCRSLHTCQSRVKLMRLMNDRRS